MCEKIKPEFIEGMIYLRDMVNNGIKNVEERQGKINANDVQDMVNSISIAIQDNYENNTFDYYDKILGIRDEINNNIEIRRILVEP